MAARKKVRSQSRSARRCASSIEDFGGRPSASPPIFLSRRSLSRPIIALSTRTRRGASRAFCSGRWPISSLPADLVPDIPARAGLYRRCRGADRSHHLGQRQHRPAHRQAAKGAGRAVSARRAGLHTAVRPQSTASCLRFLGLNDVVRAAPFVCGRSGSGQDIWRDPMSQVFTLCGKLIQNDANSMGCPAFRAIDIARTRTDMYCAH